jgi:GNAT superfamily N-acetyltransferase
MLAPDEVRRRREEFADLYEAAYADRLDGGFFSRRSFLGWFTRHLDTYDVRLAAAVDGDRLVGWMYGFRLPSDTAWWDNLEESLPGPVAAATAAGRVHAFAEIVVDPSLRRRGIARRLYAAVRATWTEADFASLGVLPDNAAALAAYASWGWRQVGHFQIPGGPRFAAMVLDLRAD